MPPRVAYRAAGDPYRRGVTKTTTEAEVAADAPANGAATEPDESASASSKEALQDHARTVCTNCAPVLENEKARAVDNYAAVKLMFSYGDEWECVWRSLEDRRGAIVALSLMAEQMCQELAHHQKSTVEAVWGRLIADQFRDFSSLQPPKEKAAPNVVRQAEKAAAVGA